MIFLTSIDRIFVPRDAAAELVTRLGGDPAATAILEADDRGVRLSPEHKRTVLAVLAEWPEAGEELRRLRYELSRDLA